MKRRFVITLSIGSTIREEIVEFEDRSNVILGAVLEDARLKIQNECGLRVIMESATSLGWMLFNIWLTLVMLRLNKSFISGWDDYAWLLLCSVVSPITIYFAGILHYKLEISKRKKEKRKEE